MVSQIKEGLQGFFGSFGKIFTTADHDKWNYVSLDPLFFRLIIDSGLD